MDYPQKAPYQPPQPVVRVERPKQTLEQWAVDVCKVKDCYDGFLSREVQGYSTVFACPVCDRHGRDVPGYQSVPSAKHWMGSVEMYTPQEMLAIVNRRQEVARTLKQGAGRMPDVQIEMVAEDPF